MTTLDPEYLKRCRKLFHSQQDAVDQTIEDVMIAAYEALTGKKASDRFREKVGDAVRFEQ